MAKEVKTKVASEPFLINPLYRKRIRFKKRRFSNPLPSPLLRRMTKRYGKKGMTKAWEAYRRGIRRNPLGEEVIIVGANPIRGGERKMARRRRRRRMFDNARRRRRRAYRMRDNVRRRRRARRMYANPRRRRRVRRYRRYRDNAWFGESARHATAARRGWRRRRRLRSNPVRRRRGRFLRDNPATIGGTVKKVLPLAITGGASIIATNLTPGLVGVTSPWTRYGVQAATALAGGWAVGRFVGREHGVVWTVTGAAVIVADLLQKYVLRGILPGLSGFGEEYELDAFPYQAEAVSAFPEESTAGFGAYPYDTTVAY
jgi:hypothetical protein